MSDEWDGIGLPPVGIKCQVLMGSYWIDVNVVGKYHGAAWVKSNKTGDFWTIRSEDDFRPIQSLEEKAISDFANDIGPIDSGLVTARDLAVYLIDKGYRKSMSRREADIAFTAETRRFGFKLDETKKYIILDALGFKE